MEKLLTILIIFVGTLSISATDFDFKPERLTTDYNGVTGNSEITLCYGRNGIITFSKEEGESWGQFCIGDEYNILKVIEIDGNFFGIAEHHILKSENGFKWEIAEKTDDYPIKDLLYNGELYFAAENGIFIFDETLSYELLLELDTNKIYQSFAISESDFYLLEGYKFIENTDQYVFKYNFDIKTLDTLEIDENFYQDSCSFCEGIKEIFYEDGLYFTLYKDDSFINKASSSMIVKYENSKMNKFLVYMPHVDPLYYFKDGDFYYLDHRTGFSYNHKQMYTPYLWKLNNERSLDKYSDSLSIATNKEERYFTYPFDVAGIHWINEEKCVVVGNRKTIFLSKDRGKTWLLKSQFFLYDYLPFNFYFIRSNQKIFKQDSTLIGFSGNLYKSTDEGILWKPTILNSSFINSELRNILTDYFYFDLDQNGLLRGSQEHIFVSEYIEYQDYRKENNRYYNPTYIEGVFNNEEILFSYNDREIMNKYSIYEIYDKDYNFVKEVRNDSMVVGKPVLYASDIYALSMIAKDYFVENKIDYYNNFKYVIVKSTDNGRTWIEENVVNSINITLPLKHGDYINYLRAYPFQYSIDDKLLIPNFAKDSNKVIVYDCENNSFSELLLPITPSSLSSENAFFEFQDNIFFVGSNFKLYWTEDLFSNTITWDSLDVSKYFNNWDSFDIYDGKMRKDLIYSVYYDSKQIYLTIANTEPTKASTYGLNLDVVKLFDNNDPTSVENIEEVEVIKNYLYLGEPYPNPTSSTINLKVYYNDIDELTLSNLNVYNIFGEKVQNIGIEIFRLNNYSSMISFNCKDLDNGVYFAQVKNGQRTMMKKIVIAR